MRSNRGYPFNHLSGVTAIRFDRLRPILAFLSALGCFGILGTMSDLPDCAAAEGSSTQRPNIVLIIPDDLTYRDLGLMGNRLVKTPHLDRLADRSARYPHGYVPTSVCSPSLATLLTGLYPHQHGIHYNHPPPGNAAFNRMASAAEYERIRSQGFELIRSVPTLPRVLAANGYRCLQTGKFWEGHFRNAGFTDGMTLFKASS
ncbi:MAG: sulfatase-like hydrolase/transferase, partial [Planctomycetaceae bacterium]|nr:sulfatase-like hydrolase/transferase [Planctomycetaceae bacterium]